MATEATNATHKSKEERTRHYSIDVMHKWGDRRKKHFDHHRDHWKDVQTRRAWRGHRQVELEEVGLPAGVAYNDAQLEMMRYYEEQHAARSQANSTAPSSSPPEAALSDFIVGEMKPRLRLGSGYEPEERELDAADDSFEVLARPSAAKVRTLDEDNVAAPEPYEEWECLDREDERPREVKPSYALVVAIQ